MVKPCPGPVFKGTIPLKELSCLVLQDNLKARGIDKGPLFSPGQLFIALVLRRGVGSSQDCGLGAQIWGWSCCSAWLFSSESLMWELGANCIFLQAV